MHDTDTTAAPEAPDGPDAPDGRDAGSAGRSVPISLVAVIAGLLVGAGVVAVLAITGFFRSEPVEPPAQDELVLLYEHSRQVSYTLEGQFSRTKPDGSRLESDALVVQRPPDTIRRQLGGITGRVNGHRVNCNTDQEGRLQCAEGAEVGTWAMMVDQEMANLRSYFDPAHPVYAATKPSGDCFELRLLVSLPDPPYGVRAVMCFDRPSGAMRSIEVEHEGGVVDRLESTVIRPVTKEDFSLDGDDAFAARTEQGGS